MENKIEFEKHEDTALCPLEASPENSALVDAGELRTVWLDDENKVMSFHKTPNGHYYKAFDPDFITYIQMLIHFNYAIQ